MAHRVLEVMTNQLNGEQAIIRGYYALPAMIERDMIIDFYIWAVG